MIRLGKSDATSFSPDRARASYVPAWWATLALVSAPFAAQAAETVIPVTPPGATDVDQAYLPPPGFYGGMVVIPFNQNSHSYDSNGNQVPAARDLKVSLQLLVPAALYVYPFQLFGGSLATSFVQPVERLSYSIGSEINSTQSGLADAYSDVLYWTRNIGLAGATPGPLPLSYGLSIGAGMALIVPDGAYSSNKPLNPSGHFWVIDPNVAATYNSGPKLSFGDNTQLSARVFYGVPLQNPKTRYTSGNVIDVDWSVTEQFGTFRAGVAGYYQTQLTNDVPGNGAALPNGNKFSQSAIGPVFEYFVPQYNMFLKAKYEYTFYRRNFVDEQLLVLSVGFKL